MSEISKNVLNSGLVKGQDTHYRSHAVAAALEVIAVAVAGTSDANRLASEMSRLSEYADLIQEAIKVK